MIVSVTFNPAVDHTVATATPLEPGTVVRSEDERFDAGGKGINVSTFLAALEVPTAATGLVGGFTGTYVRERVADGPVEAAFVEVEGLTRINETVLAPDGEYKLNQAGPRVDPAVIEAVLSVVREYDPSHVVVAGSFPPGLDASAADRLAAGGDWDAVVDLAGNALAALSGRYALAHPNREELATATGVAVETPEDCARAADALRTAGVDRVLVSLGAEGALLVGPDGRWRADPPDVEVVDTVGAGDALLAGYLAAVVEGRDAPVALRRGTALAGRVVERAGTGVPAVDAATLDAPGEGVAVERL